MHQRPVVQLESQFEGHGITTVLYRGRPCWVASEVGRALGYAAAGHRLAKQFLTDWATEFDRDVDYAVLSGPELAAFKLVGGATVPSKANRAVLVLFEPGIHGVLLKTSKPAGVRLRRWLRTEVLPQLARTGRFLPEPEPEAPPLPPRKEQAITPAAPAPPADPLAERRLRLEERRLEQVAAEHLRRLVDHLEPDLPRDVATCYRVAAAELAVGHPLEQLRPRSSDPWLSPSQIAQRLTPAPSLQMVGRLITSVRSRLGVDLRGDPRYARQILCKASGRDGLVTAHLYSPRAVEFIVAEWNLRQALERSKARQTAALQACLREVQ